MKVAFYLRGGLGNQLFQYACLIAYAKKYNLEPIYDRNCMGQLHEGNDNFFLLTDMTSLIKEDVLTDYVEIEESDDTTYVPLTPPPKDKNVLLKGFFNDERYFSEYKSEIIDFFRNCFGKEKLETVPNSLGIHIRRGDYLIASFAFNILNKDYYKAAISFTSYGKTPSINGKRFIFGENQESLSWFRNNLPYSSEDKFISNNLIDDFCQLASCDEIIIANSTYSWWAAYLSKAKNVIFPMEWFSSERMKRTMKYNVIYGGKDIFKYNWKMVHSNNNELLQALYYYVGQKDWERLERIFCSLVVYYPEHYLSEDSSFIKNHVEHVRLLYRYATNQYFDDIEMRGKMDSIVRRNVNYLQLRKNKINLDEIPIYMICSKEREMINRSIFKEKGLNLIFIEPVSNEDKNEVNVRSYFKALKYILKMGKFPCLLLEDKLTFTDSFMKEFPFSDYTDAIYLETSQYQLEKSWNNKYAVKGNLEFVEDVSFPIAEAKYIAEQTIGKQTIKGEKGEQILKYFSMRNNLTNRAVLYMNNLYTSKVLTMIGDCIRMNMTSEIGTSSYQRYGNILCMEKPMFTHESKESILNVNDFTVKPLDKNYFIENFTPSSE